ncbi:uncharacterized protein LOC141631367 [Silene latifolia]|uniref:uncharacterized protein LOC141631367 n=1 Tax=Silene latifolia TaxID=37657 RepID=UPI003D784FFA
MGSSLAKRSFQADPSCKICAAAEGIIEIRAHLFRDCGVVKRIKASSDLGIRVKCAPSMDIVEWITNWVTYLGKSEGADIKMIKFLGTLWYLLVVRNRVVFHEDPFYPQMFYGIWRSTMDIVVEAWEEGGKGRGVNSVVGRGLDCLSDELRDGQPFYVVGTASSCTTVKVMVDVGWKSVREAGLGWIAHGDDGTTLFSRSIKIKAQSALQAEALGLKDVLVWARDQGIRHLDISSDCLKLLLQITGVEMAHHLKRGIMDDMGSLFPFFHCLSFTFIPRRFNKTAHDLAKMAMSG